MTKLKLLFYTNLLNGPLNVCSAVASTLLDKYFDKIEVYFLTDLIWANKLSERDSRFKFEIYKLAKNDDEDNMNNMIENLEKSLNLPYVERYAEICQAFLDNTENLIFVEKQISDIIERLKPNYILCDLMTQTPSVIKSKIPYGFIISFNPLALSFDDYPPMGLDIGVNDKEEIKSSKIKLEKAIKNSKKNYELIFHKMNVKYDKEYSMFAPRSDYLSIYCYPKELDYYNDEIRKKYKLLQIDSPIITSKLPEPYKLPETFANLPGKIIYVSLGSLFSLYYTKIQKLIDVLAELPYKYIVSKGHNGCKIRFPNNRFIGENFINQLAVLQVVDMMIAHGGNNTFTECFYFGIPVIIIPLVSDQINNAKRIEETGFGYRVDLMNFTQEELKYKIHKVLTDETLNKKVQKVSQRIKNENKLVKVVDEIFNYIQKI
uniref:UDP-glycosyltransferase n=1 Tax=Polyphagotarsonemus latus TaxID=1204166 RepID=A0AAN0N800_9ACAR